MWLKLDKTEIFYANTSQQPYLCKSKNEDVTFITEVATSQFRH
jgi:hypothetical protein